MSNRLEKIEKSIIIRNDPGTVNLIGDPGCDGLGAGTMSIFARALTCSPADFSFIAGDLVPYGSRGIYDNVCKFVNTLAAHPVYTLCGNHDTDFYEEYFGRRNYALVSENLLMIALDNSRRSFSPETLEFCRSTLEEYQRENIVILFHIPPPNPVTTNTVNPPEWETFREIYLPWRNRIRYFICGHVHSLIEFSCDGIPVIVTGGGGARIEPVNDRKIDTHAGHHIVQLYFDEQKRLNRRFINLESLDYSPEMADPKLREYLEDAWRNETAAHFRYKLLSEKARDEGWTGLAALFRALSDSEFRHAGNHYYVLNRNQTLTKDLQDSISSETREVETMYREYRDYAQEKQHSLARYSFNDALNAEKVHKELLERALEAVGSNEDIPVAAYYTCSSCGYTFETESPPARCPVCGAPGDKIFPSES